MKKSMKFLALFLVLTMLLPVMPIMAAEEGAVPGRVEIVFCVGDKVLSINGQDVEVETPYVVGAGVTLVPARVITEAFGAKVGWVHETKTVTIDYPDVQIVLQIDNPIAEVNGKAETLLSPPELTANGFTMIPLRFISETFGATVTYDEVTKEITVVKEAEEDEGDIVQGALDAARVGDSYYSWSMDTHSDMELTYRSFDATITTFAYDADNWMDVSIWLVDEDYDFNRDFTEWKATFAGYTLVKADKDASKKMMHFQAKNKTEFIDLWQYVVGDYAYIVMGTFLNSETELRDEGIKVMESFTTSFTADSYDLSNVEDGMRQFTAEELSLTVDIPQDFFLYDEEALNEFSFYRMKSDDDLSVINIDVYSKSTVGSAKELAEKDYNRGKRLYNEKLVTFSAGVEEKTYAGFTTYEYSRNMKMSIGEQYARDVFFEKGAYVYNIHICFQMPYENADATIDRIISSVIAMEIDENRVGILMRNEPEVEGTYTSRGDNYTVTVPNAYLEEETESGKAFVSTSTGATIILDVTPAGSTTYSQMSNTLKQVEKDMKQEKGVEIIKSTSPVTIGGQKYAELTFSQKDDEGKVYFRYLVGVKDGQMILWLIGIDEISYSSYTISEVETMVASLQIK